MKRVLLGLGALAFVAVGLAFTVSAENKKPWTAPKRASRKKNPVKADAASIAAGKKVYKKQCESCHGDKGKGDGPAVAGLDKDPGDLTTASVAAQSDGTLYWKLTSGRKPMPTFVQLLTPQQRWQVINFVRTLGPKKAAAKKEETEAKSSEEKVLIK